MKKLSICALMLLTAACGSNIKDENSTPIDSTNTYGTAPATYGADDPTDDTLTNSPNYSDTGTKANEGPDSGSHR